MKLIEVHVKKFRNILDSGPVEIEPSVTCLVGKNESGKTAFLHALYRLHPARANAVFSIPEHYPAWLEKHDRLQGADLEAFVPVTARFVLDEAEVQDVETKFGPGCVKSREVTVGRNYSGVLECQVSLDEEATVKFLLSGVSGAHKLLLEVRRSTTLEDLRDRIRRILSRQNVSKGIKDELHQVDKRVGELIGRENFQTSVWRHIEGLLPRFFYFHTYSSLPYSVNIQRVLKQDEKQLNDGEITARSLLRLAAAGNEYLINPDYERRKRELENVANALTADILTYWTQNRELRVHPDITQNTVPTNQGQQAVVHELKLRIWDARHLLSLPFNEHSSGFQWFFSFLAAFAEFQNKSVVILLDEPALALHARAQRDFLRFIEERLSRNCQVIYTTHSPFMVQPGKLERVRIVEDRGREEGAKVSCDVLTTDPDTLFPLQGALGYDMAQHLFIAPHSLVVEGTSDFTYLTVFSEYLKNRPDRVSLDEQWSIVPVGGADLIPSFVALLGNHLDVTVLVDSQKAGHQKLSRLSADGYLAHTKIVTIGEILDRKLADIEDLFLASDYLNLYNLAFSTSLQESDLVGTDPLVSRVARVQGIERFDHGRPADVLLRQKDTLLPLISEDTLANFERLFARVNSTMSR